MRQSGSRRGCNITSVSLTGVCDRAPQQARSTVFVAVLQYNAGCAEDFFLIGMMHGYRLPLISEPAALTALRGRLLRSRSGTSRRVAKERVMIRSPILCVSLAFGAILLVGVVPPAHGQEGPSVQQSIEAAQEALRHRHYLQAIRTLEDSLQRFPGNTQLRLELGRAYIYQRQDGKAIEVFRAILRDDPSKREPKLELARVLSFDGKYEAANQLFHELLATNPNDEAAGIGLVRNLLIQKKRDEARREVEQALAQHPNSIRLQEYRDDLVKNQSPVPASRERVTPDRVQADASYFGDSAGNHAFRAGQRFDLQVGSNITNSFRLDEKSLWVNEGAKANIFSVNDEGRLRLARWLSVGGGGGIVRFADNSNAALYRGTLILHPFNSFWLQGGFSRIPITPTFQSAQFDLLAEGWWSRLDWQSPSWRVSADFSKQHYSDSNRTQREDAEVLRWIGNAHFAVGLGYQYAHRSFAQTLANGYFNPNQYHSHLGLGGFRFEIGKIYRGEYIAEYGAEAIDQNPYQTAWEATLKNRFVLGKLEMGADYTYFHLAQSTGAFRAQVGRASVAYRF
jgi:cytochrome c-type biogenesis protein CcmH/NrfG